MLKNKFGLRLVFLFLLLFGVLGYLLVEFYVKRKTERIILNTIQGNHWQQMCAMYKANPGNSKSKIFLGNSLTEGFNLEIFNDSLVVNRGISGDFTSGVLLRLNEIVEAKPAKIFIEIGINDLVEKVSAETIIENYARILFVIRQKTALTKIYVQSILPVALHGSFFTSDANVNHSVKEVNARLRKLAEHSGITYIDIHSHLEYEGKLKPEYTTDGIHLTDAAYLIWRDVVLPFVKEE